jgi:hypothetical protein
LLLGVEFRAQGDKIGVFLAAGPADQAGRLAYSAYGRRYRDMDLLVLSEGKWLCGLEHAVFVNGLDGQGLGYGTSGLKRDERRIQYTASGGEKKSRLVAFLALLAFWRRVARTSGLPLWRQSCQCGGGSSLVFG